EVSFRPTVHPDTASNIPADGNRSVLAFDAKRHNIAEGSACVYPDARVRHQADFENIGEELQTLVRYSRHHKFLSDSGLGESSRVVLLGRVDGIAVRTGSRIVQRPRNPVRHFFGKIVLQLTSQVVYVFPRQ